MHYLLGSDFFADGVGDDSEDLMNNFRGTKGKWSYSPALGEIKSDHAGLIADLVINGDEDENGMVMAAATDLLDVLQNIVTTDAEVLKILTPEQREAANSAIAKALGQ
ncbi:hypothetical protein [Pantoea sp. X85]|uniref:hypothetical protein n=1 Tax=Pantoea sp. X85 TaxID=3037258 RepID=UPI00241306C6|nr:hypothetical protein [Pantoea sp. X85]WFL66408.1 hypothetical protein P6287_13630 [Pantoea sp. X85]